MDDGYYLITSSLGTNLILATTNVNIVEKNEYPSDLKVAETASVSIGEDATYYIKVFLPSSADPAETVTVHDEMASVLKFNADVQVCVSNADPGDTAASFRDLTYTDLTEQFAVKTRDLTDACTFEIEITPSGLAGKYLVFRYSAELTSDAEAGGNGYGNK